MKKRLLALGLLSSVIFVNAQNVYIPDANFKAKLVANANINTNNDTEIQLSEAATYTGTIAVGGSDITDLTGIEAFTEITALGAFNNYIESVDLSKNTKLTQLLLENNPLQGDLDLSHMTQLRDLKLHTTGLTNLNVANGNNTNFTRFNIASSNALRCIQVDDVAYSNNNWTRPSSLTKFNLECDAFGCYKSAVDTTICAGTSYTFPDLTTATLTEDTVHVSSFAVAGGCDSVITTTVQIIKITDVRPTLIGGNLCNGTDLEVSLNTSETGVTYNLQNNASLALIRTKVGTGARMNFQGFQSTQDLKLNVEAVKEVNGTTCSDYMSRFVYVVLVKNAAVTASVDSICAGETIDVNIKYSTSGYRYKLVDVNSNTDYSQEVIGDGEEIDITSVALTEDVDLRVYATNQDQLIAQKTARIASVSNFTKCGTYLDETISVGVHTQNTDVVLQGDSALKAVQDAVSYQWIDCKAGVKAEVFLENETNQLLVPGFSSSFKVQLESTKGCIETSECVEYVISGLAGNRIQTIQVLPNPAQDFIRYESEQSITMASVYTSTGSLVKVVSFSNNELDVSRLKSGLYLIKAETKNGLLLSKFVKN